MRSRRIARCTTCGLYRALCICAALPRFSPATRITVIAHRSELFKSTNTGKLAVHMLEGAQLWSRGTLEHAARAELEPCAWVLFPSDDALPLHEAAEQGLTSLIVPDGTWNQARRIARRDPACAMARRVRLEVQGTSAYRLRRNGRSDGLCTLEAIAEALRVLEGSALADAMLAAFAKWVRRAERVRAGAHEQKLGAGDDC